MNQNKALELTKDIATDIIGGILIAVGVHNHGRDRTAVPGLSG